MSDYVSATETAARVASAAISRRDVVQIYRKGTGNPDMSRASTLQDLPSLSLPCETEPNRMPLGLKISERPDRERDLLSHARRIETVLGA